MRDRAELLTERILAAVALKPMTSRELATVLCARDESVRQVLLRNEGKRVRRAGLGPKPKLGVTPYLWVAA